MNKKEKIQKEIDKMKKIAKQHYEYNRPSMEKSGGQDIKARKSNLK